MADLYYGKLNDDQREKIQFVLLNDNSAVNSMGALKAAGSYNGNKLPAVQDDGQRTLMNALSNNNPSPKDDMILVDKNGKVIKYLPMRESNMGDKEDNNVRSLVLEVVRDDFKPPDCASRGGQGGGGQTSSGGGGGKGNMSPLDELKAYCMLEGNCAACKGRMRRGACALKKKLKCKLMQTREACEKAKCSYKAAKGKRKAKCKGKGVF